MTSLKGINNFIIGRDFGSEKILEINCTTNSLVVYVKHSDGTVEWTSQVNTDSPDISRISYIGWGDMQASIQGWLILDNTFAFALEFGKVTFTGGIGATWTKQADIFTKVRTL